MVYEELQVVVRSEKMEVGNTLHEFHNCILTK